MDFKNHRRDKYLIRPRSLEKKGLQYVLFRVGDYMRLPRFSASIEHGPMGEDGLNCFDFIQQQEHTGPRAKDAQILCHDICRSQKRHILQNTLIAGWIYTL